MDKKEASFILANIDRRVCDDELNDALDMAIKALEQEPVFFPPCQDCNTKMDEIRRAYDKLQEPSGDAISRKIIAAFLSGLISDETERKKALEYINELPPVIPQPKTGHWEPYGNSWEDKFKCSECGKEQV